MEAPIADILTLLKPSLRLFDGVIGITCRGNVYCPLTNFKHFAITVCHGLEEHYAKFSSQFSF
jgi:hypothetical protein